MASIVANGIRLEYESLGDEHAPVMLLIMGLATQLIAWPDPFCERLVQSGFRVIRYDNRDCGLSQKFDELGTPRLGQVLFRALMGLQVRAPYLVDDMAADAVGLLDALGISRAHVVGASMGGMIGQVMAAQYPDRVLSLTSIMSTTGARHLKQPSMRVRRALLRRPADASNVEVVIDHYERLFGIIGSPAYRVPREELRANMRRSVQRGYCPAGAARQLTAVVASGDRSWQLGRIACPTLVIHGKADPLVPCEGGVDTAYKIRDAKLVLLDGFGHDLPPQLFGRIAEMVASHAHEATG